MHSEHAPSNRAVRLAFVPFSNYSFRSDAHGMLIRYRGDRGDRTATGACATRGHCVPGSVARKAVDVPWAENGVWGTQRYALFGADRALGQFRTKNPVCPWCISHGTHTKSRVAVLQDLLSPGLPLDSRGNGVA